MLGVPGRGCCVTVFPVAPEAVAGAAASLGTDPITLADLLRVANSPGFDRWQEQIRRTGGCAHPIRLRGETVTRDRATGDVLYSYSTEQEPGGMLRVAWQPAGLPLPGLRLDLRRGHLPPDPRRDHRG